MNFISLTFIAFLLIVFIVYFLIPKKYQWIVLLVASVVFYVWANVWYALFLLASILITYCTGILLNKENIKQEQDIATKETVTKEEKKEIIQKHSKAKKAICVIGIILNLSMLFVVKYLNFLCANVVSLLNVFSLSVSFSSLDLILPIGLSFYTFQSLGYIIDVYRGTIDVQKNFFKYALFVAFFPQVLQGPIGRYEKLAPQLYAEHDIDLNNTFIGTQRIILGFFKKVAVADIIGLFVDSVFANPSDAFGIFGIMGAVGYAIQLYADFSGFMDIAIGTAKIFGIELEENFDRPYLSKTIAEYWRRWHITLGAWFRDYVYYPLLRTKGMTKLLKSKNKKVTSKIATTICLLITWLSIGIWHGANWTFILHGLYYGVIISFGIIMDPIYKKLKEKLKINENNIAFQIFQICRTFIIVCFGYILFRSNSLNDFGTYVSAMFSNSGIQAIIKDKEILTTMNVSIVYIVQIVLACITWFMTSKMFNQFKNTIEFNNVASSWKIKSLLCSVVLVILIAGSYIFLNSLGVKVGGFIYYEF